MLNVSFISIFNFQDVTKLCNYLQMSWIVKPTLSVMETPASEMLGFVMETKTAEMELMKMLLDVLILLVHLNSLLAKYLGAAYQ